VYKPQGFVFCGLIFLEKRYKDAESKESQEGCFSCHGGHDDLDPGAWYGGAGRFADGSSFLKTHSLL
jgi:hypothetical protein